MTDPHPLDRPAWNALKSGWAALAQGNEKALRLEPDHGPFGASADFSESALTELAALIPPGGEIWTTEGHEIPDLPGAMRLRSAGLVQMVASSLNPMAGQDEILDLQEVDSAEMRALAHLTQPGPFFPLTHRLGNFVGIRREGTLVAMAGERMRLDGYCEVSGVCTRPECRGQGLAGAMMSVVAARIFDRGETPFLHSYATNAGAIALYERLGFAIRKPMTVTIFGAKPPEARS
ncbi:MAG: GNAT family N-acetyltransferase [Sphingomonadales bacterium]|nr:GNAT family N-acetyltransferase [Sphingomonadales bacterium]